MAEKSNFKEKCEQKINEIQKQIDKNKSLDPEFVDEIKKIIAKNGPVHEYIKCVDDYAVSIREGEKYKSNVLNFINNSHIDFKKLRDETNKALSQLKEVAEDAGINADSLTQLMPILKNAINLYKSKVRNIKKEASEEVGLARVETLEHNLLYCKGSIESSNKIGFLDYLLYLLSNNVKYDKIKGKLRAPFEVMFYLKFNNISKKVDNFLQKINKSISDMHIGDLDKNKEFNKKANEQQKKIYNQLIEHKFRVLAKGQIKEILKSSFNDKFAASAYYCLGDVVLEIITARALAKTMNANLSCIDGNPDKLIEEGGYDLLINSIKLFCAIFLPGLTIIYNICKAACKIGDSLVTLGKGVWQKVKGKKG